MFSQALRDIARPTYAEILEALKRSDGMAVIFHLTNHYALVFATRERSTISTDGSATITRELLTSKAGQAPKAWIPFAVARRIMRGWSGYKMVVVMRAEKCETFATQTAEMAKEDSRDAPRLGA